MRVEDAETAMKLAQDSMRNAEKAGLTTTKPETTFEQMLNASRDSMSDLASSDDGENGEDEDDDEEDSVGGELSKDDKPGWVMVTISKMVEYGMERCRQMQMKLDELTQPGWGDAADYIRVRDGKYGTTELNVPAVVQCHTADDVALSMPTTFGEPMETLDSIRGELQMPQVTSPPGSTHMRRDSREPQTHEHIPSLSPAPMPDWALIQLSNHVEPVSFDLCI